MILKEKNIILIQARFAEGRDYKMIIMVWKLLNIVVYNQLIFIESFEIIQLFMNFN